MNDIGIESFRNAFIEGIKMPMGAAPFKIEGIKWLLHQPEDELRTDFPKSEE